jgi:orotidine-5'-phosphate decarboxylase
MRIKTRIVLALDDLNGPQAVDVASRLAHGIDAVKVGYPLVLTEGLGVVRDISEVAPVICDFKVADIPAVSAMIVERAVSAGAAGVIVHGFVGEDTVREAAAAAGERAVFVVTEMSHPGALDFIQPVATDIAAMARRAGATGIIAPATRPERVSALRQVVGPDMLILSPGVGTQGGSAGETVSAGADAVIVGRSLYRSSDPEGTLASLLEDLANPS